MSDAERRGRAERLAYLLDSAVRVPGTNYRFGLDAVLGLLPGVGDAAAAVLSSYVVLEGYRAGVPRGTLARMILTVVVDVAVGAVPVVGDLFDFAWKANTRNVELIRAWENDPASRRNDWRWVVGALLAVVTFFVAVVGVVLWLLSRLVGVVV